VTIYGKALYAPGSSSEPGLVVVIASTLLAETPAPALELLLACAALQSIIQRLGIEMGNTLTICRLAGGSIESGPSPRIFVQPVGNTWKVTGRAPTPRIVQNPSPSMENPQ